MTKHVQFLWALGLTAATLAAHPAQADLVFEYRTAAVITQQTPGTLIDPSVGLQLQSGGPDVILQIVLKDTGTVGAPSPANPVFGAGAGSRLIGWGFRINFAQNGASQLIATSVQPLNGADNARTGLTAFGYEDPVIINGSDGSITPSFAILRNLTLSSGAYDPSNLYPLANIRIHPDAINVGTGSFSIVDTGPSDDIGTVNNPGFDAGIFDQSFVLPVTVTAVPEPTSLVLCGVGLVVVAAIRHRTSLRRTVLTSQSHVRPNATRAIVIGSLLTGLLVFAVGTSGQAASLAPGGVVTPAPGVANPPNAMLSGTVLADVTTLFANGGVAPASPTTGQLPVTITFRGTNSQVPTFLALSRYQAAGATFGATDGLPTPALTGTLRTIVVREAVGGTLDFYLQVANTSAIGAPGQPNEIFRISAGGFNTFGFAGDALDVFFRTDGGSTDVIPGALAALLGDSGEIEPISADRNGFNNFDPAFDFSPDLGGGNSIYGGQLSRFLLIRTNAMAFGPSVVTISSTGTAYVSSLAPIPVPEPTSLGFAVTALLALAISASRLRTVLANPLDAPCRHR